MLGRTVIAEKPTLHLADVKSPTGKLSLDAILRLYRQLTGREPTPEEVAEAKKTLEEAD